MSLSSTVAMKRKKEVLYVSLDFAKGLTKESFVNSGTYVSAIAQNECHRIKQAPSKIFKNDDSPSFQIQLTVRNGQLERLIATVTLKNDNGDHTLA